VTGTGTALWCTILATVLLGSPSEPGFKEAVMLRRIAIVSILALVLTAVFAPVAWGSITTQIIQDASDGVINGHYTVAEVRAALKVVEDDPAYSQYSDVQQVLEQYLASLLAAKSSPTPRPSVTPVLTPSPSATPQQLDYTGGQPLPLFACGGLLLGAGALLWRRTALARRS
jgi:hypothetical protein